MPAQEQIVIMQEGSRQLTPAGVGFFQQRKVFSGAAKILGAGDSGALCVWSTAAGYLYTLPAITADTVGIYFDFYVAIDITSVGAKVITATGDFIYGSFIQSPDSTTLLAAWNANGTTIVSWNGNGTTTGGYAGDFFRLTAWDATRWLIQGLGLATGTEATPFATS